MEEEVGDPNKREGAVGVNGGEGVPLSNPLEGHGSVVSFPRGLWGRAPTEIEFDVF